MILVVAMLVVPLAAASRVAYSFRAPIPIAIAVAEVSTLAGITVTLTPDVAASGRILLLAIGSFAVLALVYRYARLRPA